MLAGVTGWIDIVRLADAPQVLTSDAGSRSGGTDFSNDAQVTELPDDSPPQIDCKFQTTYHNIVTYMCEAEKETLLRDPRGSAARVSAVNSNIRLPLVDDSGEQRCKPL
jgi:hypothetical protein